MIQNASQLCPPSLTPVNLQIPESFHSLRRRGGAARRRASKAGGLCEGSRIRFVSKLKACIRRANRLRSQTCVSEGSFACSEQLCPRSSDTALLLASTLCGKTVSRAGRESRIGGCNDRSPHGSCLKSCIFLPAQEAQLNIDWVLGTGAVQIAASIRQSIATASRIQSTSKGTMRHFANGAILRAPVTSVFTRNRMCLGPQNGSTVQPKIAIRNG